MNFDTKSIRTSCIVHLSKQDMLKLGVAIKTMSIPEKNDLILDNIKIITGIDPYSPEPVFSRLTTESRYVKIGTKITMGACWHNTRENVNRIVDLTFVLEAPARPAYTVAGMY